jgi:PPOX class probable F420-dependent enzyme
VRLGEDECRRFAALARVATLATLGERGADLVPFVFAVVPGPDGRDGAGDRIVTAVDHKPKATTELARLANIERDPRVTVLVHHYDDDSWDVLWWVRARGRARVVRDEPERSGLLGPLVDRYRQYRDRPPEGPVVVVEVDEWTGWSATAAGTPPTDRLD